MGDVVIQKPYLNAGCEKIILPAPQTMHHLLVDPAIYYYPAWVNVDRNAGEGVDQVVDLFSYPWPFADNSFDGALLAHIVEHIPHEIRYSGYPEARDRFDSPGINQQWVCDWYEAWGAEQALRRIYQDGWSAFFSELWRVLTPGAIAHILCPYAWSQAYATDYTHVRPITEQVWTHEGMGDNFESPFAYKSGCNFKRVEPCKMGITSLFRHLLIDPTQPYIQEGMHNWDSRIIAELQTRVNVVGDLYVKLEAVK
jgi:SAM-dependent methyltransferase